MLIQRQVTTDQAVRPIVVQANPPQVRPTAHRASPAVSVPARPAARRSSRPSRLSRETPGSARPVDSLQPVDSLPLVVPPTLEFSSVDMPRTQFDLELEGMWRTLSWDGAQAETGEKLPHIDGLPVVQVQLQASDEGKKPLMVVAQQLSSGEVIRTIEGPMSDVSHLLARRTMTDPDPSAGPDSGRPKPGADHIDRTMAMQRGDRMLVITGALPQDSLLAMIRRLNAEMRSK